MGLVAREGVYVYVLRLINSKRQSCSNGMDMWCFAVYMALC